MPTFVPSTELHALADSSSTPLPKVNFTSLWSGRVVLVLEIWPSMETIFKKQPMFQFKGEVVM